MIFDILILKFDLNESSTMIYYLIFRFINTIISIFTTTALQHHLSLI